jgi:hypothetical protein
MSLSPLGKITWGVPGSAKAGLAKDGLAAVNYLDFNALRKGSTWRRMRTATVTLNDRATGVKVTSIA